MKKTRIQYLLFLVVVVSYSFIFLYLFGYIGNREDVAQPTQPIQPVHLETTSFTLPSYQIPMGEDFPNTYGRKYPITDGKTYRIISVGKPCSTEPHPRNQEAIEVRVNGKWKEVYRVEDRWNSGGCNFPDILIAEPTVQLSPLGDYVNFRIVGNEWTESELVNTKTKEQIFPQEPKIFTLGLAWSKDARNYAFFSHFSTMGSTGKDAVWVSKYKEPDSPMLIFDLAEWAHVTKDELWEIYGLNSLKFVDNQTVQFSIFDRGKDGQNKNEVARYQYDLEKEKLKEIFRK